MRAHLEQVSQDSKFVAGKSPGKHTHVVSKTTA
jgi:hypothetical protein